MKNIILLLTAMFLLIGCGNRAKTNSAVEENSTPVVEETVTATGAVEESQPMPTVSEEVGSVNKSKGDSSAEWDALLNDYEQYIDSYISCLKKASNGDMSAMTEYVTLLEKAQSMTEKIEKISDNLTPAQSQRYLNLNQKLLNAASDLTANTTANLNNFSFEDDEDEEEDEEEDDDEEEEEEEDLW